MIHERDVKGKGNSREAPINELIGRKLVPKLIYHHYPQSASLNLLINAGEIIHVIKAGNNINKEIIWLSIVS